MPDGFEEKIKVIIAEWQTIRGYLLSQQAKDVPATTVADAIIRILQVFTGESGLPILYCRDCRLLYVGAFCPECHTVTQTDHETAMEVIKAGNK
jgi:hypothetical protein